MLIKLNISDCQLWKGIFRKLKLKFWTETQTVDEKKRLSVSKESASFYDMLDVIRAAYLAMEKKVAASQTAVDAPSAVNSTVNSVQGHYRQSVLPALQLATFDGKIEQCLNFISLFESLVHNDSSVSPTQKMQYLRANLRGEPLVTISTFVIEDASYQMAYETSVKRYQNPRRIANFYVQLLIKFKSSATNSTFWTLMKVLLAH